jgi:hypothetical protein
MGIIRTTYEIITDESAEQGDVAERGWRDEEGAEYDVDSAGDFLYGCEPSSSGFHAGVWFTAYAWDTNYRTGAVENRSYHLDGFSESEQRSIFERVTRR